MRRTTTTKFKYLECATGMRLSCIEPNCVQLTHIKYVMNKFKMSGQNELHATKPNESCDYKNNRSYVLASYVKEVFQ